MKPKLGHLKNKTYMYLLLLPKVLPDRIIMLFGLFGAFMKITSSNPKTLQMAKTLKNQNTIFGNIHSGVIFKIQS